MRTFIQILEYRYRLCFFLSFVLSVGLSYSVQSQTYVTPSLENSGPHKLITTLGSAFASTVNFENIKGNSVFLTQIGEFNSTNIKNNSSNSSIEILQEGSFNKTTLNYTARTVYANIEQRGKSNTIVDNINNKDFNVSLELIQDGNNLNFVRDNVNRLTKTLKFTQSEASPSLIIRSMN